MKKLLSFPPNAASQFNRLTGLNRDDWFCSSDPDGMRLGSGGGTAWLLDRWIDSGGDAAERKIVIHSGGQSRRLPAYAGSGKMLIPVPVFRWQAGQRIDQTLLDIQLPLYERIMSMAPENVRTLVASGDVYIRAEQPLQPVPDADVICYGLWVNSVTASHHGVFTSLIDTPQVLDKMLQKPDVATLAKMSASHMFLMDIGIWLLSDKAVKILKKRSVDASGNMKYYDLYTDFGGALGMNPIVDDKEVNELSVAVLPLPGGEFYHFGTTGELIGSALALQCKVMDQRELLSRNLKPHPSLFVQNCRMDYTLSSSNNNVWIENSHIAAGWNLSSCNVVTGVPRNDWHISLREKVCIDVSPVKSGGYVLRPYGYDNTMSGCAADGHTRYLDTTLALWLEKHAVDADLDTDIQLLPVFPVIDSVENLGLVAEWMISPEPDNTSRGAELYRNARKLSADDIMREADLETLFAQRKDFLDYNIAQLAANHSRSVMYQVDLVALGKYIASRGLPIPDELPEDAPVIKRMRNLMLRSRLSGNNEYESRAWQLMRNGILEQCTAKSTPRAGVMPDQIVWGRSPLRIDLAGGWTDTPPYSLCYGGNVLNLAVELNNQSPLQVFLKPCAEPKFILRSIDLGASEVVSTYEDLNDFTRIGSPFSIPKAALALCGFSNEFSGVHHPTLYSRLKEFGGGIEITLMSAVGAGSGLGTSSILAATVLGALSNFCGLGWDTAHICLCTLALEQLLTTGGGWQDQYGGVLPGIKLLQSASGMLQAPSSSWLPERLFTDAEYAQCHILYYTGITRTAKNILSEIVRGMTLNSGTHLQILEEMKSHAIEMAAAVQRCNWNEYGSMLRKSWELNKRLDRGTNPESVENMISAIKDYATGYKLPGAGGGGYLYIVAKDPVAAARIRDILGAARPNPRARLVDMKMSASGMQITRS